jgi:hypothetical protein
LEEQLSWVALTKNANPAVLLNADFGRNFFTPFSLKITSTPQSNHGGYKVKSSASGVLDFKCEEDFLNIE